MKTCVRVTGSVDKWREHPLQGQVDGFLEVDVMGI